MTDLYKILDVARDATDPQIKRAYKAKAQEHHPDKNDNSDESVEMFKKIKQAHDVLIDPITRKQYDESGNANMDSLYVEAVRKLVETTVTIIFNTDDVDGINMHSLLKLRIAEYIKSANVNHCELLEIKDKYLRTGKKFIKKNNKYNIFHDAMKFQGERVDKNIKRSEHEIEVANKMLEILDEYSYQLLLTRPIGFYSTIN